MQNVNEEIENYLDVLDTDFSDWDDDFFSENVQFSDVENVFKSQSLIKNLQTTGNRFSIKNGVSPLCQDEDLLGKNVAPLNWKKAKMSILDTLNTSRGLILPKQRKQIVSLNQEKILKHRQSFDEPSDSEDFCNPNKKRKKSDIYSVNIVSDKDKDFTRKGIPQNLVHTNQVNSNASVKGIPIQETAKSQSDSMTISSQETAGSQMASVSSQGSYGSKMIISSQEISANENMVTSSQENSTCQNIFSSQECCKSPKMVTSSQESLGNQVMNISIEDPSILNVVSQSSSGNGIPLTPHINSDCRQISTHEALRSSKSNSMIQSDNTKTLNKQQSFSKDLFSVKKIPNSISDSSSNKIFRRYNKPEKRITWTIRKRELEVKKREDAIEIREKMLDAREAAILKREKILIAKEKKYLRYKASMKKINLKQNINSKKMRKKLGVLEETNAYNKCTCI